MPLGGGETTGATLSTGLGEGGLGTMPLGGSTNEVVGTGSLSASARVDRTASTASSGLGEGGLGTMPLGGSENGYAGEGTLSASGLIPVPASVSLSGTGTASAAGIVDLAAAASLAGAGALAAAPSLVRNQSASLAGAGTASASASLTLNGSVTDTGLGRGGLGSVPLGGGGRYAGEGTLSASGERVISVASSLSGAGTLSPSPRLVIAAASAQSGSGSLGAFGAVSLPSSASLAGTGSLSTATSVGVVAAASLSGSGALGSKGGFADWRISGESIGNVRSETREYDKLELEFRVREQLLKEALRPLDRSSGRLSTADTSDGGFVVEDMAGGDNTYAVEPPVTRQPLRQPGDFVVEDYREDVADQQGNRYDVVLELHPDSPRDTDVGLSEDDTAGEWYMRFHTGEISTPRVDAENTSSVSSDGTESRTLSMLLTAEQATVIEESATLLAAARTREVEDGTNVTEDNSPGNRNTVQIEPPAGEADAVPGGEYVVVDWKSVEENADFQRFELVVSRSG
jgi:hypothetical protein